MSGWSPFFWRKNLSICIFTCFSAIAALFLLVPPPQQTEIAWHDFSVADIHQDMEAGKVILISTVASWNLGTIYHEYCYSQDPEILHYIQTHPVACYRVDLARLSVEQFDAWKGYFHSASPLGVLLMVQTSEDDAVMETITISNDPAMKDNLISRLEKMLSLRNPHHTSEPQTGNSPKQSQDPAANPAVSAKPAASLKHQSA